MKITESSSPYDKLENMPVRELLENINREDHKVPVAVEKAIPQIEKLVHAVTVRMEKGGRLFYIGAGRKNIFALPLPSILFVFYKIEHG